MPQHTTAGAVRNGPCCAVHGALPVAGSAIGANEVLDPVGRGVLAAPAVAAASTLWSQPRAGSQHDTNAPSRVLCDDQPGVRGQAGPSFAMGLPWPPPSPDSVSHATDVAVFPLSDGLRQKADTQGLSPDEWLGLANTLCNFEGAAVPWPFAFTAAKKGLMGRATRIVCNNLTHFRVLASAVVLKAELDKARRVQPDNVPAVCAVLERALRATAGCAPSAASPIDPALCPGVVSADLHAALRVAHACALAGRDLEQVSPPEALARLQRLSSDWTAAQAVAGASEPAVAACGAKLAAHVKQLLARAHQRHLVAHGPLWVASPPRPVEVTHQAFAAREALAMAPWAGRDEEVDRTASTCSLVTTPEPACRSLQALFASNQPPLFAATAAAAAVPPDVPAPRVVLSDGHGPALLGVGVTMCAIKALPPKTASIPSRPSGGRPAAPTRLTLDDIVQRWTMHAANRRTRLVWEAREQCTRARVCVQTNATRASLWKHSWPLGVTRASRPRDCCCKRPNCLCGASEVSGPGSLEQSNHLLTSSLSPWLLLSSALGWTTPPCWRGPSGLPRSQPSLPRPQPSLPRQRK